LLDGSLSFGWPLALLFAAAACYNFASIAVSSIYSTALTEPVEARSIGAAYAVRSVMGFGAGVISPWCFGSVIDMVRKVPDAPDCRRGSPLHILPPV
jgi:fucose permease